MYWQNLEKNKCPRCSKLLSFDPANPSLLFCKTGGCDFKISARRMAEVIRMKASQRASMEREDPDTSSENDDIL